MSRPKIYLIDDDPDFCQLVDKALEDLGVDFSFFVTIPEYLEAVKKWPPQISMVDLHFDHEGSGFEVLTEVHKSCPVPHPLIALSDSNDMNSISYALELGASDFMTKPLERSFLIAKLLQYVETAKLNSWSESDVDVPGGGAEADISLDVKLTEIDEYGMRFVTPHLVAKGTVVHIHHPVFEEIMGIGVDFSPLLTVMNSKPCKEGHGYDIYAELSKGNEDATRCIRNWISEKNKANAA